MMSEFEEIFGEVDPNDLSGLIAIIRDNFDKEINHYIPIESMGSGPACVLFAIFQLLKNDLKDKEYLPFECIKV